MEPYPVMRDDAGGFLAAMLQGMQAQSGDRRRIGHVPDSENAALFMRLVIIDQIRVPALAPHN
jgi:hypothetical protein